MPISGVSIELINTLFIAGTNCHYMYMYVPCRNAYLFILCSMCSLVHHKYLRTKANNHPHVELIAAPKYVCGVCICKCV